MFSTCLERFYLKIGRNLSDQRKAVASADQHVCFEKEVIQTSLILAPVLEFCSLIFLLLDCEVQVDDKA